MVFAHLGLPAKGWAHPAASLGVCPTPSLLLQYYVPSSLRPPLLGYIWLKPAGGTQGDEQAEPQQPPWHLRDTVMGERHEAESMVWIWVTLASRDSSNHSSITWFLIMC